MTTRSITFISSLVCFIAYSVIATVSGGSLSFAASPLLAVAVGLLVWNARLEDAEEARK